MRSQRPPLAISLALAAAMVLAFAYLRFIAFPNHLVPLAYPVCMLMTLWDRRYWLLWTLACCFMVMSTVKLFLFPFPMMPVQVAAIFWGMQLVNIALPAGVIHAVVVLLNRIETQAQALAQSNRRLIAVNAQLESSNQQLAASKQQVAAQNQELEQRVAERTAVAEQRARQLSALAHELAHAEQRERQRLARLLHDHLQQMLVAAKMQLDLEAARDPHSGGSGRARDLVLDAIKLSRSLTVELSPPVLHSADFAAALQWLARHMNEKHRLQVQVQAQREIYLPESERFVLFQAARELLFNVVKHADVSSATLMFELSSDGWARLTVEDHGRGMSRTPQDEEGFGLFSLRERVGVLGGRMELTSAAGQGTRVVVQMPPRAGEPVDERAIPALRSTSQDERSQASLADGAAIRVLLVDDHQIIRDGLAGILEQQPDIELVGGAGDGLEAIEQTRQFRPDVVIMDINMPRMDGLEATRRIREEFPDTQVIGLSMHPKDDMAQAMRDAGAAGYLTKDEAPNLLLQLIRSVTAKRQAA